MDSFKLTKEEFDKFYNSVTVVCNTCLKLYGDEYRCENCLLNDFINDASRNVFGNTCCEPCETCSQRENCHP